jgi:hypothetical protein
MIISDPLPGDDFAFASNFKSVADEKRAQAEKEQARALLRILEEMEGISSKHSKTEYLRISETGDIIRDEEETQDTRKKIMQIDDLPKESIEDMIFGREPDEPAAAPIIKVENGRRLRDGKTVQHVNLDDKMSFSLSSVRFETLVFWGTVLVVLFFIFRKMRSISDRIQDTREKNKMAQHHAYSTQRLDELIDYKVNEKLNMLLLKHLT